MLGMKKCKVCGAYMTPYIKSVCGDYKLVYGCTCGHSTEDEYYLEYTNHT